MHDVLRRAGCRYEEVRIGEPAELLLLSNTPDFSSFKVRLSM